MKALFSKIISYLVIPLLAFVSFVSIAQAAPNAALGFRVSQSTFHPGDTIAVTVTLDANEFGAGSIRTTVKYDPAALDYASLSESDSDFDTSLGGISVSNGLIKRSRGNTTSGVSGTGKKVFDINFKAKATGSTTLSFDSDSHVWEAGSGTEEPLNLSNTLALSIVNTVAASTPTPAAATATPKPATPKPTVKPVVTAKPTATPVVVKPVATTAPTATGDVSASTSTVTLSKTSATADGVDAITANIIVRTSDGTVLTDVQPTLAGLRDSTDTATGFTFDAATQSWSSDITSTTPGTLSLSLTAKGVTLANQDVTFTEATAATTSPAVAATTGSSSFTRFLIIGLIVLILLLILLFFLYKRLRKHDDDDDFGDESAPAYPGEGAPGEEKEAPKSTAVAPVQEQEAAETAPAPAANPAPPVPDEVASFDPNQALQRSQPPSQETPPAQASDDIPL